MTTEFRLILSMLSKLLPNRDLLLRMQAWHDATQMRARADEIDVRRYLPA